MFKKNRTIANQKAMIKNRDRLIEYQGNKIIELQKTISEIRVIANSNLYGTDGRPYLNKIKELVETRNHN